MQSPFISYVYALNSQTKMLKTKRSDALVRFLESQLLPILILPEQVDVAKRRKELLGSIVSTASASKSSSSLEEKDIFEVETDPLPCVPPSAAATSPQKASESSRSKAMSGVKCLRR